MTTPYNAAPSGNPPLANGSGAAAIFSAGAGCFVLAVLAIIADKIGPHPAQPCFLQTNGASVRRNHGGHSCVAGHLGDIGVELAEKDTSCRAY